MMNWQCDWLRIPLLLQLHKIGPKYVFNTGIVVTAAATIAFGYTLSQRNP